MPVPVLTVAQMREWEQATWKSGETEEGVIARVGERLAARAMELTKPGDRIALLAGKGHNGDDASAMEKHLHDRQVELVDAWNPVVARPAIEEAFRQRPALIVDGLFGIGLNRPLDHDWLELIARINHARAPILAVDVPSGLNADTGAPITASIRAVETVTVGAPKRGLLHPQATPYVGRLTVIHDVGLVWPCPIAGELDLQWTLPSDFEGFPPHRMVTSHKGTFGHVGIVAGSQGYHGASVLAARGAQRARPGLITLFTQPDTYAPVAAQLQAVMVSVWKDSPALDRFNAVLFGPGLASENLPAEIPQLVRTSWLESEAVVVVDASALAWLPEGPFREGAFRVMTPHPGEAAHLLGTSSREVQEDRVKALRELSSRFGGCWVVLKGNQTLIGRADGEIYVNSSGGPSLAQGGTGDLLSGYLAGWLAQPHCRIEPLLLLRYAVWEHGAAADRLDAQRGSWVVEELAQELGRVQR